MDNVLLIPGRGFRRPKLWLDASTITGITNNATVASWTARTGQVFSQGIEGAKPIYIASSINGLPGVRFDAFDSHLDYAGAPLTGSAGVIIAVVTSDVTTTGAIYSQANSATTNANLTVRETDAEAPGIVQKTAAGTQVYVFGSNGATTARLLTFASNGVAYTIRRNGVGLSLTESPAGSNNGNWFADTVGMDRTCLGAYAGLNFGVFSSHTISELCGWDGVKADSWIARMERIVARRYGISLG